MTILRELTRAVAFFACCAGLFLAFALLIRGF